MTKEEYYQRLKIAVIGSYYKARMSSKMEETGIYYDPSSFFSGWMYCGDDVLAASEMCDKEAFLEGHRFRESIISVDRNSGKENSAWSDGSF